MKYLTLLFCLLYIAAQPAGAQNSDKLAGDWKGKLSLPTMELDFSTHFRATDEGYAGTMDIPQQGLSDYRLTNIALQQDSASWEMNAGPNSHLYFSGAIKSDTTLKGNFLQNGRTYSFVLHKQKSETPKNQEKLPYKAERLIFKNNDIPIGGTLTLPKGKTPQQVLILISGSGAQNRDEELFGFKRFKIITNYLTRHGIATFRFDDRGIGESGGNPNVGFDALSQDVEVIVDSLSNNQQLKNADIGLLGHSQGGDISYKVAARDSRISFIVLTSAPAFSGDKFIIQQTKAIEQAKGTADSVISKGIEDQRQLFSAFKNGKLDSLRSARIALRAKQLQEESDSVSTKNDKLHERATQEVARELAVFDAPIFQSLLSYEPANDIRQLDIPVLALFGEKDLQVLPDKNAGRLRKLLSQSDAQYQIKILDSANHLYQHSKTGLLSNYKKLDHSFVDDFLPTISQWIKNL